MSKEQASRAAKIDSITWTRVEDGYGARDTTYAAIERALQWQPSTVHRITAGLEPGPVAPAPDDAAYVSSRPDPRSHSVADADLDTLLAEIARRARDANPEAR